MNRAPTIPGLDHLRALAIVLVFLFHYGLFEHPTWVESIGAFGWIGVDLFFVLSGYLIADQLFRSQARTGTIGLRTFYVRRAFRILPAYGAMVALYFLFPSIQERATIAPLWKFVTFTMNLGLDLRQHRGGIDGHNQDLLFCGKPLHVKLYTRGAARLNPRCLLFATAA